MAQNDIKLENLLLATAPTPNREMEPKGSEKPSSPTYSATSYPVKRARGAGGSCDAVAALNASLQPSTLPGTSLAGPAGHPRVVIVDFARARCEAPPGDLAREMQKLERKLRRS